MPQATFIGLCYLAAPAALFLAGFVHPIIAAPGLVYLGVHLYRLSRAGRAPFPHSRALAAAAIVWTLLIGFLPPFIATADTLKHQVVLNALVTCAWPPSFGDEVLRYYVGWHLVPASFAAIVPGAARAALFLWTAAGVYLVFSIACSSRRPWIFALVFALFSGLDVIGYLITRPEVWPHAGLEWWSGKIRYLSTMNLLLWVPQHALPGWLLAAMLLDEHRAKALLPHAGLAFAAAALWSPFAAVGALPLLAARSDRTALSWWNAAAVLAGVPICLYLLHGSSGVSASWIWNSGITLGQYLVPLALEVAPWFLLLALAQRLPDWRMTVAVAASLLGFPLLVFGHYNDWMLRTTIPALAVLAFRVADAPARPMLLVLAIACVSPLLEVRYSLGLTRPPARWLDRPAPVTVSLADLAAEFPWAGSQLLSTRPAVLKDSPPCSAR